MFDGTRADFNKKFKALIESYNAGRRNIEQIFDGRILLSRNLDEERSRHVRENLGGEDRLLLDILTRAALAISSDEHAELKEVAPWQTADPDKSAWRSRATAP